MNYIPNTYAQFRVITIFINRITSSPGLTNFIAANSNAKIGGREGKVNCCWGEKAAGAGKNNVQAVELLWHATYLYIERPGIRRH